MLCLPWRQEINDTGICTKVSSASVKPKITLVFAKRKGETQLQVLQFHPSLQYSSVNIHVCERDWKRHSSHDTVAEPQKSGDPQFLQIKN